MDHWIFMKQTKPTMAGFMRVAVAVGAWLGTLGLAICVLLSRPPGVDLIYWFFGELYGMMAFVFLSCLAVWCSKPLRDLPCAYTLLSAAACCAFLGGYFATVVQVQRHVCVALCSLDTAQPRVCAIKADGRSNTSDCFCADFSTRFRGASCFHPSLIMRAPAESFPRVQGQITGYYSTLTVCSESNNNTAPIDLSGYAVSCGLLTHRLCLGSAVLPNSWSQVNKPDSMCYGNNDNPNSAGSIWFCFVTAPFILLFLLCAPARNRSSDTDHGTQRPTPVENSSQTTTETMDRQVDKKDDLPPASDSRADDSNSTLQP